MSLRIEKVNKELRRQITKIIHEEIGDPLLEFLSVTRVSTTADLKICRVYFSLLDESKYARAEKVLKRMGKFIRFRLGRQVRIKILPELEFIPDSSIKYSVDIHQKIEEIRNADECSPEPE